MPRTYTASEYKELDGRRKFAWSMFYRSHQDLLDTKRHLSNTLKRLEQVDTDEYAQKEIINLYTELKKSVDCPVCLETLAPNQIKFTKCFHKYCGECLPKVKQQGKCAVCRKKI